jgi:hypothetical protein
LFFGTVTETTSNDTQDFSTATRSPMKRYPDNWTQTSKNRAIALWDEGDRFHSNRDYQAFRSTL